MARTITTRDHYAVIAPSAYGLELVSLHRTRDGAHRAASRIDGGNGELSGVQVVSIERDAFGGLSHLDGVAVGDLVAEWAGALMARR